MKTIILAVLGFLAFAATSFYNGVSFAEEKGQIILKTFEYKVRRGDNLTHLAKRFDTTKERLLWANNSNPCVKNENLILRGCKLTIPDIVTVEEALSAVNEESHKLFAEKQKNIQLTSVNSRKSFLLVSIGALVGFLFVGLLVIMVRGAARRAKTKNEKTDLSGKLWAAEDKVKKMEIEKADLKNILAYQQFELGEWSKNNQEMANKLNALASKASFLPGNYVELQSRENGKIKAKIIKVRLGKNGELEVYVACPAEEHCLVNASENLKAENALSHVYKQHGTSQDLKPNGWTE